MKISRNEIWQLLGLFAVWRGLLILIGKFADSFLNYAPSFPYAESLLSLYDLPRFIYSWSNFDGVHYVVIAERGYGAAALIQAFFPFYPLLMRYLQLVVGNTIIVGLVISNLSFLALIFATYYLARVLLNWSKSQAFLLVILLLVFPTSLFFGAVYSESLFLLMVVVTFILAFKKHFIWAALVVGLASATRLVGIFLVVGLLIELYHQFLESTLKQITFKSVLSWQPFKEFLQACWLQLLIIITFGSLGLMLFSLYLTQNYQDPLYFLHVQSEFGAGRSESLVLYPQTAWRSLKILIFARPIDWKYFTYFNEFLAGTLTLVGLIMAFKYVRPSIAVYSLLAFLLPTLTGNFSSMPRYLLVCLSLFMFLALVLDKRPLLRNLILLLMAILLIINTVLFIQGYWVA